MTYLAVGRVEDARRQLTRALELAGDSPLPQFETARQTLAACRRRQRRKAKGGHGACIRLWPPCPSA